MQVRVNEDRVTVANYIDSVIRTMVSTIAVLFAIPQSQEDIVFLQSLPSCIVVLGSLVGCATHFFLPSHKGLRRSKGILFCSVVMFLVGHFLLDSWKAPAFFIFFACAAAFGFLLFQCNTLLAQIGQVHLFSLKLLRSVVIAITLARIISLSAVRLGSPSFLGLSVTGLCSATVMSCTVVIPRPPPHGHTGKQFIVTYQTVAYYSTFVLLSLKPK